MQIAAAAGVPFEVGLESVRVRRGPDDTAKSPAGGSLVRGAILNEMHDDTILPAMRAPGRLVGRRALVLVLAAVSLTVVLAIGPFGDREAPPPRAASAPGIPQADGDFEAGGGDRADTVAATRTAVAVGHAAPATRTADRRELDTADDLFEYAQRLAPAMRAGDPEATWRMSRIADYCAAYASDPAGFARDTRTFSDLAPALSAALTAARERVGDRCRRFSPSDGLSPAFAQRLRLDAARAGSLVAEAELLATGQPLSAGERYARDLGERLRRAADPDATGALASASGDNISLLAFVEPQVAPQFRELVWQLAACRMGMDCGPESALMTSYCVNGGICSRTPGQGFEAFVYDAAVPRQSADLVRDAVAALVGQFGGKT